ncbi:MAG: 50S ribosomal protein L4 [Nanoarchaeota archaeon]
MKLQILNKEGNKIKEKETELFEEPIRIDIISKVIEAEKFKHPYSNKYLAGMNRSASGNVRHKRHSWKSDRGRGLARIPKKAFWRRGTQFSWEGAIVPSTRGGRRAHPPKGYPNIKKINKKELNKALLSSLSYISNSKELEKKYSSIDKVNIKLPLIIEDNILNLKTKEFFSNLKKVLGNLYEVAIKEKSIRSGVGKRRGRKYKENAGMLFVVSSKENKEFNGLDFVKANELRVSDLASGGARLTLFSEKAIEELESILKNKKNKMEKKK